MSVLFPSLLLGLMLAGIPALPEDPAVNALRQCLNQTPPPETCNLPSGVLLVDSSIPVNRAVTIKGAGNPNPTGNPNQGSTILKRNNPYKTYGTIQVNAANVTIQDLGIDGNRPSFGCPVWSDSSTTDYTELAVGGGASCMTAPPPCTMIDNVDVSRGPGGGITLNGTYASVRRSSLSYNMTTAIFVGGSNNTVGSNQDAVPSNTISWSGTAGINISGQNSTVVNNSLVNNRALDSGGQLYLGNEVGGSWVADNVIDGNSYYNTGTAVLGCMPDANPVYSGGIEGEGATGLSGPVIIANNEIRWNYGDGISFHGSSNMTIKGEDPNCPTCAHYAIHNNGYSGFSGTGAGIKFFNDGDNAINTEMRLDHVQATNNGTGLYLQNVTGPGFMTDAGAQSDACLVSNGPAIGAWNGADIDVDRGVDIAGPPPQPFTLPVSTDTACSTGAPAALNYSGTWLSAAPAPQPTPALTVTGVAVNTPLGLPAGTGPCTWLTATLSQNTPQSLTTSVSAAGYAALPPGAYACNVPVSGTASLTPGLPVATSVQVTLTVATIPFFGTQLPSTFGSFAYVGGSWVWSQDLGYESIVPANDGSNGIYMYDNTSGHWFYTNPSLFSELYDFTLVAWIWYDPGSSNPRWFYSFTTGAWFPM